MMINVLCNVSYRILAFKIAILLSLTLLPLTSVAQGLRISFSSPGKHAVWSAPDLSVPSSEGTLTDEDSYDLRGLLQDYVLVLDQVTGNIAYKRTRDIKGEWRVTSEDYKLIDKVVVQVEYKGKPVASASIRVNSSVPKVLDADSGGKATFHNVKAGKIEVEVAYRTKKRDRITRQSFEALINRTEAVPVLIVSVPNETATLEVAETPEPGEPKEAPANTETKGKSKSSDAPVVTNFLQNVLSFTLAIGVLATLLYFGLKWVLKNEDKTQDALNKLGVNMPAQDDPADDTPPIAPVIAPKPAPQIHLGDDAQVTPGVSVAPPTAIPAATLNSDPHLILPNGTSILIPEGTSTVGREATCEIALVGESTVSRNHASFDRAGNSLILKDLGSTNGTFVNGVQLKGEMPVKRGDTVQFGAVQARLE